MENIINISVPTLSAAASMIRVYGEERQITPDQLIQVFHEGVLAIAEKYSSDDPLRVAVIIGSHPVERPNVKVRGCGDD